MRAALVAQERLPDPHIQLIAGPLRMHVQLWYVAGTFRFPSESQFPRDPTMNHPNRARSRNRTFRVEVLESRALLSTAGVVSRPAAVVAPLASPAHFSSVVGDPEYSAKFGGSLSGSKKKTAEISLASSGMVSSNPATGPGSQIFVGGFSRFDGRVERTEAGKGEIKYMDGVADLIDPSGKDKLAVRFHGTSHTGNTFSWKGAFVSGTGQFKGASGNFSAFGSFTGAHGATGTTIEFSFKADVKLKT
jgi:hypothetical protein